MATKLLIVDDEPDLEHLILQQYRRQVRKGEYEFLFALNGVEALQIIEEHDDIDIVLSDINMPKMDGLTFLSELKAINWRSKTIIVSAYGDMKNIRTAMNRGAYDFVTKPIDFEDLEATIQKTLREIENLRLAELARKELDYIREQLNVASDVQRSIVPGDFSVFPEGSRFELFAEMIPAKEVGGDFYDFFMIDDHRLGFVVGDVSGKGMPAALFMAVCRTLLKATALKRLDTHECLNQVNYLLSKDNVRAMFVTLFYGVLNLQTHEVHFTNGGHNLPCLVAENGDVKLLEKGGNTALGIIPDFEYKPQSLTLSPGMSLVLYTDGITEARSRNSEMYSEQGMLSHLQEVAAAAPKKLVESLVENVQVFAAGMPQWDDITVLSVRHNS